MNVKDSVKVKGFYFPANIGDGWRASVSRISSLNYVLQHWGRKKAVVQAGGSFGMWPYHLSKHYKWVYTFEPDWISFYYLSLNCPFENVIKLQAALSDGNKGLSIKRKSHTDHRVSDLGFVPGISIDSLRLFNCDAILLDVEGYEYKALYGAKLTIREFKPIILFEDRPGFAEYHGLNSNNAVDFMRDEGYCQVADIHTDRIYVHSSVKWRGPAVFGKR